CSRTRSFRRLAHVEGEELLTECRRAPAFLRSADASLPRRDASVQSRDGRGSHAAVVRYPSFDPSTVSRTDVGCEVCLTRALVRSPIGTAVRVSQSRLVPLDIPVQQVSGVNSVELRLHVHPYVVVADVVECSR